MNEHYPDMEYDGVGVGVRRVGLAQSRHSRGGGGRSGDGGEPAARARQQDGPPRGGEKEGRPRTYRRLHCCSATTTSSCYDLLNYGSVVGN